MRYILSLFLFLNGIIPLEASHIRDEQILKYEHRLKNLGKHTRMHVHGEKFLSRFFFSENCYLGVYNEFFENDESIKTEEGPIDLRKAEVSYMHLKQSFDYWELKIQDSEKFPKLYFESSKKKPTKKHTKAYNILRKLIPLCHEKAKEEALVKKATQKKLEVPSSEDPMAREVRRSQEDPSMKAALLDGQKSYANRLKLAHEASKPGDSLLIQTLIFMADEAGIHIADELLQKAKEGVRIELILDALSPALDIRDLVVHSNTKKMYRNFMAAGIPVYGYRCHGHHLMDEIRLGHELGSFVIDQRPHEKLWIMNGKKVILGGMNIGNDYFRLNVEGPNYWRDQDILIEGKDILQDIVNIFEGNAQSFRQNYLDPRKDSCFNPYDPIQEKIEYLKFFNSHFQSLELKRIRPIKQNIQAHAQSVIQGMERDIRGEFVEYKASFEDLSAIRVVHNRPKLDELMIEEVYVELINNAKEEILIENAYLIPSQPIVKALQDAAYRGVSVKVITNAYETNDVPPVAVFARHHYKDLVDPNYGADGQNGNAKEIEIWEWTGVSSSSKEAEQGMNHSKFMVVDRKIVFVGSYNLDPRSRRIDSEIGVVFEGKDDKLAKELAHTFLNEDMKFCTKVSYKRILNYRKPLSFIRALLLKGRGFHLQDSLWQTTKEHFFYKVATFKKDTW